MVDRIMWSVIGNDPSNLHIVETARPHMRVCFMTSDGATEKRAHLIAAAPDLYEALKAMFDRWEPDPEPYADRRMWEAARDALDKAEGRT